MGSAVVSTRQAFVTQHTTRQESRHDLADGTSVYIGTVRRPGYLLMGVAGPMPTHVADALDQYRSQEIPTKPGDPRPRWLRRSAIEDPQQTRGVAAGWPLLCLWGRTDTNVNRDPQEAHTGVVFVDLRGVRTRFPAMPMAWGLLGNTLFYGTLFGVPWLVLHMLRRAIRVRRGCCPSCGYDRPEGVGFCPECGHAYAR
ncbi:MAG: zinc ribbon domain-containing protein [Phycisphaeraceae bacterium]|nr:zinc ribbon domain-containing protein [Phycisphaeraceae bacterium]